MKTYNVKCPICGHENKDRYLEETHGWFICDHCENDIQMLGFTDTVKIPVYTMEQLSKIEKDKIA